MHYEKLYESENDNYKQQLIKSIVFFAMEYLDQLEVPADVFIFGDNAEIHTKEKNFYITDTTSADDIKDQIDEVYKSHTLFRVWALKHASLDEVKEVYL